MTEFTQIVGRWLWRFFPVIWLDWIIVRLFDRITACLEDEADRLWLMAGQANCAWLGGWLVLLEARINELIFYKAMARLKRSCRGRAVMPVTPVRALRSLDDLVQRLTRLAALYDAAEPLSRLRAATLKRLLARHELQLETVHHPVAPRPPGLPMSNLAPDGRFLADLAPGSIRAALLADQRIRAPP